MCFKHKLLIMVLVKDTENKYLHLNKVSFRIRFKIDINDVSFAIFLKVSFSSVTLKNKSPGQDKKR